MSKTKITFGMLLRQHYFPFNSGIYDIRNIKNGKMYIGASSDIRNRIMMHRWNLEANKHINYNLQNDYNKYGSRAFVIDLLTHTGIARSQLNIAEHVEILKHKKEKLYNTVTDYKHRSSVSAWVIEHILT